MNKITFSVFVAILFAMRNIPLWFHKISRKKAVKLCAEYTSKFTSIDSSYHGHRRRGASSAKPSTSQRGRRPPTNRRPTNDEGSCADGDDVMLNT